MNPAYWKGRATAPRWASGDAKELRGVERRDDQGARPPGDQQHQECESGSAPPQTKARKVGVAL